MIVFQALIFLSTVTTALPNFSDSNSVKSTCNPSQEQQVEACLQPMLSYATNLQSNGLLPLEGAQIFKKLCKLYAEFAECTAKVGCQSMSINAMQASYGYMCGDGYDQFAQHVDCFAKVETQEPYVSCKNDATSGVNKLEFDQGSPAKYFSQLCGLMKTYLTCSKPVILNSCGESAWDLVTRVTRDSLKATMPECDLHKALQR